MKITFVCLANSKKYSERCIAGIIVIKSKKGYNLKKNEVGKLQWIRPVSDAINGQVATELVKDIALFDIVEIDTLKKVPHGYQSENVLFDKKSIRLIRSIEVNKKSLDRMTENEQPVLFGNAKRSVSLEEIEEVNCSISFIKVENPHFYIKAPYFDRQLRVEFTFNDYVYDLAVTDLDFYEKFEADNNILATAEDIYFSISLGVAYRERHYKIVAGVLWI